MERAAVAWKALQGCMYLHTCKYQYFGKGIRHTTTRTKPPACSRGAEYIQATEMVGGRAQAPCYNEIWQQIKAKMGRFSYQYLTLITTVPVCQ